MRCKQTEKLIIWRTKPIRWRTDKKESWRLEFRDKILAGTKAKQHKSDSLRVNEKLAVSQQQRKLFTSTGNVLVINLRIWKKIPCTLQRKTRPKAHYFNDKLSRDSGLDAMNATDN